MFVPLSEFVCNLMCSDVFISVYFFVLEAGVCVCVCDALLRNGLLNGLVLYGLHINTEFIKGPEKCDQIEGVRFKTWHKYFVRR